MRTKKDICAIKGISEAKVDKFFEAAAKLKVKSTVLREKKRFILERHFYDWNRVSPQEKGSHPTYLWKQGTRQALRRRNRDDEHHRR